MAVTDWPAARYCVRALATAKSQVTVPLLAAVEVPAPPIVKALSRAVARSVLMAPELIVLLTTDLATRDVSVVSRSAKEIEPEVASVVAEESSAMDSETSVAVTVGWSFAPVMVTTTVFTAVAAGLALSVAVTV